MSDRIPGTTYDNPIEYRGYKIFLSDYGYAAARWEYAHDDYDGAPVNSGEGPADHRCGFGPSVEDCKAEIDAIEGETK